MSRIVLLPDAKLNVDCGPTTKQFAEISITNFRSAAEYVWRLPYGRNSNRSNYRLVMKEKRGACSTKHALLRELAIEQGLQEVQLTIGIFEMTKNNTPPIIPILEKAGLPSIPEAHCYLRYHGNRVDLTRYDVLTNDPLVDFVFEDNVAPLQIGAYKESVHQLFIKKWLEKENLLARFSVESVWSIRENFINSLSQSWDLTSRGSTFD